MKNYILAFIFFASLLMARQPAGAQATSYLNPPKTVYSGWAGSGLSTLFTPDNKFIVLVRESQDFYLTRDVAVLDISSGKIIKEFKKKKAVQLSPRGTYLVVDDESGSAVFKTQTWEEVFSKPNLRISKFSPSEKHFLVNGTYKYRYENGACCREVPYLSIFETGSWKERKVSDQMFAGDFSPDGRYFVTRAFRKSQIYDVQSLVAQVIPTFNKDHDRLEQAFFSPDGQYLLNRSENNVIQIFKMNSWELVTAIPATDFIAENYFFSTNGKFLITFDQPDRQWRVTETETWKTVYTDNKACPISPDEFSTDSRYLLATEVKCRRSTSKKDRMILDTNTWQTVFIKTVDWPSAPPKFSADLKLIAAPGDLSESKKILEVGTWKELFSVGLNTGSAHATFSPDGKYLVLMEGIVQIFEIR